jgi:hypothetical protein
MANTFGTKFTDILATESLLALENLYPEIMRFYMGFSSQPVAANQKIKTNVFGLGAAYDASSGYTAPDFADTAVEVAASNHYSASFAYTQAELDDLAYDIKARAGLLAGALMKPIFDELLDQCVEAEMDDRVVLASAYDVDTIGAIRRDMNKAGCPLEGRVGIVDSDVAYTLMTDTRVTNVDTWRPATDYFENAPMAFKIHGMTIYEYPAFKAGTDNKNAVFLSPGALVGAIAPPQDSNLPDFPSAAPAQVWARLVSAAPQSGGSGITALMRENRKEDGGFQCDLTVRFGFEKGDVNRGFIVEETE